jgi:hypothetical protein
VRAHLAGKLGLDPTRRWRTPTRPSSPAGPPAHRPGPTWCQPNCRRTYPARLAVPDPGAARRPGSAGDGLGH